MNYPAPRIIPLAGNENSFTRLLGGPPDSAGMRSGLVQLEAGAEVGQHSTGIREEIIIVLEGEGRVEFDGHGPELIRPDLVAYCPPQTSHNVVCVGPRVLRYVYVVAPTDAAGNNLAAGESPEPGSEYL